MVFEICWSCWKFRLWVLILIFIEIFSKIYWILLDFEIQFEKLSNLTWFMHKCATFDYHCHTRHIGKTHLRGKSQPRGWPDWAYQIWLLMEDNLKTLKINISATTYQIFLKLEMYDNKKILEIKRTSNGRQPQNITNWNISNHWLDLF